MASVTPIDVPRGNARRSTGPRPPDACPASTPDPTPHPLFRYLTAAEHLIDGEYQAQFDALAATYYQAFRPRDPVEIHFTVSLILCDWRERRYARLEAAIFHPLDGEKPPDAPNLAGPFVAGGGSLPLLFRLIDSNRRAYHRALKALRQLQLAGKKD